MRIRAVERADEAEWLRMRSALWPGLDPSHPREIDRFFRGEADNPRHVLVAEASPGRLVGLAELSIRSFAEGCETDRVGYLEGWWVDPEWRRRGVGRRLVQEAIAWAEAQRCTEFASDTGVDNEVSQQAHLAAGFEETGRVVCYRRLIVGPGKAPADKPSATEPPARRR